MASLDPTAVFRFAPSPNGELHLGHALSALTGWEKARAAGGRFLLRIEDIDTARSRPQFVAGIFEDLRWLGLAWEEPVLFQSTRFAAYAQAARRLEDMGLLYPCFATRAEIEAAAAGGPTDPDGAPIYSGLWRGLPGSAIAHRKSIGEPFALRIDIANGIAAARGKIGDKALTFTELDEEGSPSSIAADPARWGDAVIIRKDVPASYHLAVVVDDAWQGVTHVTRGRDLFAATHLHRLLQALLDLPEPLYQHHRLVTDVDGRKLAKSAGDTSLRALREQGATPADVRRLLGFS
jgi:glutamyl-Q tRNA(Asp) synthetase